ncbi:MAG: type II toxin-antitoxin system RelE/ParE family toxin [Chloroflexi bacterium]|nr:type II toxin-antitoxin system RelE/ParE family toxin [Chloroflexota bacterium]
MASPAAWRIIVTPHAERDLEGLPTEAQTRVRDAIDTLLSEPARGDVRKLRGRVDEWRLRVRDWRIFFTYDAAQKVVYILGVRYRREAYR